jgi:hypothetical protein
MKSLYLWGLLVTIVLSGCATAPQSSLTPMEIQALQTRSYDHNKNVVFPSVMSVFQDLGYTVNSANKDTGLITAESATSSDAASKFWLGITDISQTKATAFIEQIGSTATVRLNFVTTSKKSGIYGQSDRQDTPILDGNVYQNAFERIENAIFVRSSQ